MASGRRMYRASSILKGESEDMQSPEPQVVAPKLSDITPCVEWIVGPNASVCDFGAQINELLDSKKLTPKRGHPTHKTPQMLSAWI